MSRRHGKSLSDASSKQRHELEAKRVCTCVCTYIRSCIPLALISSGRLSSLSIRTRLVSHCACVCACVCVYAVWLLWQQVCVFSGEVKLIGGLHLEGICQHQSVPSPLSVNLLV